MPLAENIARIQSITSQHPPQCLLAVSKHVSVTTLREGYALGLRHFGENYLQEALPKQSALQDLQDICWHFIGSIQRNKTREIAQNFDWVESVDRLLIAQRLSTARSASGDKLNILIEVAISGEERKGGCPPEQVAELASAIQPLPNLQLRGLMALVSPDADQASHNFRKMAALFRELHASGNYPFLDTLSMGTSTDYLTALQYGATEIRLGTTLFGARHQEPS
jgi:pyridoxal phosphate enzyme (YggS family)